MTRRDEKNLNTSSRRERMAVMIGGKGEKTNMKKMEELGSTNWRGDDRKSQSLSEKFTSMR